MNIDLQERLKTRALTTPLKISLQIFLCLCLIGVSRPSFAQVDDDQLGGWYMYFWSLAQKGDDDQGKFGLQGDIQYRNWNVAGDLEQLMLRGGVTYQPARMKSKFTLGYANITKGDFGESDKTVQENRIYQEALVPQRLGTRVYLTHRYRYEQRLTDAEKVRTRFRYALFINVPLNQANLKKGAVYLALYDELFVNGQRDIGGGAQVEFFDINRAYGALGYSITDRIRTQFGYMQQTTNSMNKGQLQLSLHQSW